MVLKELKALASEKRLQIIYALSINDFCQVHIIEITGLSQVDISRNIKVLIDNGLVIGKKDGNRIMYSLSQKLINEYPLQLKKVKREYEYLLENVNIDDLIKRCEVYKEN